MNGDLHGGLRPQNVRARPNLRCHQVVSYCVALKVRLGVPMSCEALRVANKSYELPQRDRRPSMSSSTSTLFATASAAELSEGTRRRTEVTCCKPHCSNPRRKSDPDPPTLFPSTQRRRPQTSAQICTSQHRDPPRKENPSAGHQGKRSSLLRRPPRRVPGLRQQTLELRATGQWVHRAETRLDRPLRTSFPQANSRRHQLSLLHGPSSLRPE